MKNFVFIFLLLLSAMASTSQNIIPLTDTISFVTSRQNVEVSQTVKVVKNSPDGKRINIKMFDLKGDNATTSFYRFDKRSSSGNDYNFFALESNLNVPSNDKDFSTDDTLFFKLDDVYGWGFFQKIYLARPDNPAGVYMAMWLNDTVGYFTGVTDTFDIISIMPKNNDIFIIFDYNYNFYQTDTLYISSSQAPHPITMDPVDENGQSINNLAGTSSSKMLLRVINNNGSQFFSSWNMLYTTHYFVSDYYLGLERLYFASSHECHEFNDYPSYMIEYPLLDSIVDSVYFTNPPDSLVNVVTNFSYYHKRDYDNIGFASMIKYLNADGSIGYAGNLSYSQAYKFPYWESSMHLYKQNFSDFRFYYQHYIDYTVQGEAKYYIASPEYEQYNDSLTATLKIAPIGDAHYFANYDSLFFGKGLVYYWNIWANTYSVIHVTAEKMGMWGNWIYPNDKEDSYILKDGNNKVIATGLGLEVYEGGLSAQRYTLTQKHNFTHFNGYTGTSIITSHLDLNYTDHTPPVVSNVYFVNDSNTMKYQFYDDESIILKFTAADFIAYNSYHDGIGYPDFPDSLTTVWIKRREDDKWQQVEVQKTYSDSVVGSVFRSDLTNYIGIDSALYDIKIKVVDFNSNDAVYLFSPAFVYGAFTLGTNDKPEIENSIDYIVFTPNPVSENLHVLINKADTYHYIIYSQEGISVQKGNIVNKTVNVSTLPSGVYVMVMFKGNKKVVAGKFIKSQLK